jgi:hypothetical protein
LRRYRQFLDELPLSEIINSISFKTVFMEKVLDYFPKQDFRKRHFRYWHVESLLNQAADLMDKCMADLREYNSLLYNSEQFKLDLSTTEKELILEKQRLELFEREVIEAQAKIEFNKSAEIHFDGSIIPKAQEVFDLNLSEGLRKPDHSKAGQNLFECKVRGEETKLNLKISKKQLEWATSDKLYNENRVELRQKIIEIKNELAENGLAFDFQSQVDISFEKLKLNYQYSLDRVIAAKEGLEIIYGYQSEIEQIDPSRIDKKVQELFKWISNSMVFLVAYGQLDQAFTKVISLFSLLNTSEQNRITNSVDECLISLRIPNDAFNVHDNVRLRGIGASLLGDEIATIPWGIEVAVPEKAIYKRANQTFFINQKELPVCVLGRVENRASFKNIEMCGAISLMNASPFAQSEAEGATGDQGLWIFKIKRPLNTSESFHDIRDIVLELSLTGKLEV